MYPIMLIFLEKCRSISKFIRLSWEEYRERRIRSKTFSYAKNLPDYLLKDMGLPPYSSTRKGSGDSIKERG